jgi:hypothetical protein
MPDPELPGRYVSSQLPPVEMPAHRTEYYSGDLPWQSSVLETTIGDGWPLLGVTQSQDPKYRPGRRYHERWNGAVLNITVGRIQDGSPVLVRHENTLYANFNGLTDGGGYIASPYPIPGNHLSLYRGDTLVGEFTGVFGNFGSWNVAAEPTTYRMEYTAELPDPFLLSRRMTSVWTFTTSADQQGEPPLTSIGFRPDLALDNSGRAGSTLTIPLTFAQQGAAGWVKSAEVSVSFDDGATWIAAPTVERHGTYTATVQQPKHAAGFVSLRATAVDSKGNTVTTTVYRAYHLK